MKTNFLRQGSVPRLGLILVLFLIIGLTLAVFLIKQNESTYKPTHAGTVPLPTTKNFILGGNFETRLSAWVKQGVGTAQITTAKNEVHGGSGSIKLVSGNSPSKPVSIDQSIILSTDQEYKILGYFMTSAAKPKVYVKIGGANSTLPWTLITMAVGQDSKPNWNSLTGMLSLPLENYKSNYSNGGLPVTIRLQAPQAYSIVVADDFKLSLSSDQANVIQNGSFESWRNVASGNLFAWTEHDALLKQDVGKNGGYSVRRLGVTGAKNAPYIDQDITMLLVKGGDYVMTADVKGNDAGVSTGWVSVSQELAGTSAWSPVKEVNAFEEANGTETAGQNPCENIVNLGKNYRICRYFFTTSSTNWTTVSVTQPAIHIMDNAIRVWVNVAASKKGNSFSDLSIDNLSLVFRPTTAPAERPVLLAPVSDSVLKMNNPILKWARTSGLGGNMKIDDYLLEVSNVVANADGTFPNDAVVYRQKVNQVAVGVADVSQTIGPLTNDGKYYWHVKAENLAGLSSAWSEAWNFFIDTKKPGDVKLSINPKLGSVMGGVTLDANWEQSSDPMFAFYTLKVKDSAGKVVGGGEEHLVGTSKALALSGLNNGDYTVELKVVDQSGRGNSTTKMFSLREDAFKKLNQNYWTVDAETKESVTIKAETLKILDTNNEKRDDNTGVNSPAFVASQFDMKLNFVSFAASTINPNKNSGQAKLTLYVPQGNTIGYEAGINSETAGLTFKAGGYSGSVPAIPFTVGISKNVSGLLTTSVNGQVVDNSVTIQGQKFGGVGILTKQAPPAMPDITASFDNFRLVWVN